MDDLNRPFRSYMFALAALLIGIGYIAILWVVRQPNVSRTYEAFYIDQTLRSWPGSDGLSYALGADIPLNQDQPYLLQGWSHTERAGRWTQALSFGFLFDFQDPPPQSGMRFELDVARLVITKDRAVQNVEIVVAGRVLAGYELMADRPVKLAADIPPALYDPESFLKVEIRLSNCVSPFEIGRSDDKRCLGLFASGARITAR